MHLHEIKGGNQMAEQNDRQKQWAKIVAKAWADEDYKRRLMDDPGAVLSEEGMKVPEGLQISVVEATEKQAWLVLPPKPETGKIGRIEEGVERLAAADGCCICLCYNLCVCW